MIGEAKVKLLERNETYTVNFPNGFGRSILTVPWSELGGKCVISCDSSGYKAVINFHTKVRLSVFRSWDDMFKDQTTENDSCSAFKNG